SFSEKSLIGRTRDPATPARSSGDSGGALLTRALGRARWSIFWERLWPAVVSLATVIGLFLALSWLGLWLWLPPIGRAVGLGIFFLLAAAAFSPFFLVRIPSRADPLHPLDRTSLLDHP